MATGATVSAGKMKSLSTRVPKKVVEPVKPPHKRLFLRFVSPLLPAFKHRVQKSKGLL